jgi:hypothetical protein
MIGRCGCSQLTTLRLQLSLARTLRATGTCFCILKRNSSSEAGVVRTDPAAAAISAHLNPFRDRPARSVETSATRTFEGGAGVVRTDGPARLITARSVETSDTWTKDLTNTSHP